MLGNETLEEKFFQRTLLMLNIGSTCKSNLEMNLDGFGGKRSHDDFMLALFPVNADQRPEGKL